MGELVRVVGGRHRRADGDVFQQGAVFEATETELEGFGDKFQSVEETADGYESTETSTAAEGPAEAGRYRLVRGGTHRTRDEDGDVVIIEEGEEVYLTAAEVEAFGDKFEPVESDTETEAESVEAAAAETVTTEDETDSTEPDDESDSEPPFDPNDYSVDELEDHLEDVAEDYEPEQLLAIKAAEENGENRTTATDAIDSYITE